VPIGRVKGIIRMVLGQVRGAVKGGVGEDTDGRDVLEIGPEESETCEHEEEVQGGEGGENINRLRARGGKEGGEFCVG